MNIRNFKIPKGDRGIEITLKEMNSFIQEGAKCSIVRNKAVEILRRYRVEPKDKVSEVKAIFDWVKKNIRFTEDPHNVELVQSPKILLQTGAGDCDDIAVLLSALLRSVGYETKLKTVSVKPSGELHHVYVLVNIPGYGWIPLDPTEKVFSVGDEVLGITRQKTMGGLGMFEFNRFDQRFNQSMQSRGKLRFPSSAQLPIAQQRMAMREVIKGEITRLLNQRKISKADLVNYLKILPRFGLPSHIESSVREALDIGLKLSGSQTGLSGLGDLEGFFLFDWIAKGAKAIFGLFKGAQVYIPPPQLPSWIQPTPPLGINLEKVILIGGAVLIAIVVLSKVLPGRK